MSERGSPAEQTCSKVLLLAISIILSSGISVWLGYQYYWAGSCGIPLFVVITTTVFVVFFYVAALTKLCGVKVFRENATVFTVSLACIYIVYLSWLAMASRPDDDCELNFDSNTNTVLQIVFGLIFTFLTLMSIAMASADEAAKSSGGKKPEATSMGGDLMAEKVDTDAKATNEEAALFPVTIPTIIFQAVMVITSMYYGMLFSNWGDAMIDGENDDFYGAATFTLWVKIVSLWFTLALFTVSVTLKLCCPNKIGRAHV